MIISVLVILFFILLMIDLVQLIVFLVRGIKLRRRTSRAGYNSNDTSYNPNAPPLMSSQMREKSTSRDVDDARRDSEDRGSSEQLRENEEERPFTRSSMTLGNNDQSHLKAANSSPVAPPIATSHFNERF